MRVRARIQRLPPCLILVLLIVVVEAQFQQPWLDDIEPPTTSTISYVDQLTQNRYAATISAPLQSRALPTIRPFYDEKTRTFVGPQSSPPRPPVDDADLAGRPSAASHDPFAARNRLVHGSAARDDSLFSSPLADRPIGMITAGRGTSENFRYGQSPRLPPPQQPPFMQQQPPMIPQQPPSWWQPPADRLTADAAADARRVVIQQQQTAIVDTRRPQPPPLPRLPSPPQLQQPPALAVDIVQSRGVGATREIGAFDTRVDRFATSGGNSPQRVVLPADLGKAPIDAFMRRPPVETMLQRGAVVGTQFANANTQLLRGDDRDLITRPNDKDDGSESTTTMRAPMDRDHTLASESPTPYTTYPIYDMFPRLINHAHEDRRPATGRRVGPQGRFGGSTNEYREDLGLTAPNRGILDRRRPWEWLPNRFDSGVANRAPNADAVDVALVTIRDRDGDGERRAIIGPELGEDKTISEPFGVLPMGRYGAEYREFTTASPQSRETTTLIGVPLYPEFSASYRGQQGRGPASSNINGGIDNDKTRVRLVPDNEREILLMQGIRPYNSAPEEITRSLFRERTEALGGHGRSIRLDLLNE